MSEFAQASPQSSNRPSGSKKKLKLSMKKTLIIIILLLAVGAAVYFRLEYGKAKTEINRLSNPQEIARLETAELTNAVGELVALPENETPTIATVSDISKLKDQPFFSNAQNGDKVLIYTKAKKAFMYRPSTNKVIEIAPINIGDKKTN